MQKVLIIEDHADMRELLTWQVELMGFLPIPAKHGKEGIEKAIAEKPRLILMDIMMPGMDGYETIRHIRMQQETRELPIIALTAKGGDTDLRMCIESGANDCIVKPVDPVELKQLLDKYLATTGDS